MQNLAVTNDVPPCVDGKATLCEASGLDVEFRSLVDILGQRMQKLVGDESCLSIYPTIITAFVHAKRVVSPDGDLAVVSEVPREAAEVVLLAELFDCC